MEGGLGSGRPSGNGHCRRVPQPLFDTVRASIIPVWTSVINDYYHSGDERTLMIRFMPLASLLLRGKPLLWQQLRWGFRWFTGVVDRIPTSVSIGNLMPPA